MLTDGHALYLSDFGLASCQRFDLDADERRFLAEHADYDRFRSSLAAITSFLFNLGAPRYRASTLRRRVDAEDWPEACAELLKWTRGGGRILPGLVKRRSAEAELLAYEALIR